MTSISKNVSIDKLDNIVNKYNNAYHSTSKMKPVDVKSNIIYIYIYILTLVKKLIIKTLNLKLVTLLENQNIKTFLLKAMFQIGLKKYFWLKKFKIRFRRQMLLVILKAKKLLKRFTKKNSKKTS